MDLIAALATGFAGGFAMCRNDLSAVLPGVAIAISLVPPLGVVGVCAGQGLWDDAFGALVLFLSNVVALVIAGSIVFTMGGYARDPGSSPTANRRRAYTVVTVLALIVAVPLAANSIVVDRARAVVGRRSSRRRGDVAEGRGRRSGVRRRVERPRRRRSTSPTDDGAVPPIDDLQRCALDRDPELRRRALDVGQGVEHVVQ